ncbi:MAG: hypothetical protein ACRCSQ_03760 [Bacteroidales bacterium]
MKKISLTLMSILMLMLFTPGCSVDKNIDPDAQATLAFELNLTDNFNLQSKSSSEDPAVCASTQELIDLANARKLYLNITIDAKTQTKKIIWNGSKFISDPVELSAGDHTITEATIVKENSGIVFSAVNTGAEYAPFVPETLPKTITIGSAPGNIPVYQKTLVNLYLLCVQKETPEKFGFVKWNIHFTKLHCLPFIINACNKTGEHFVASGNISIKNGTYRDNIFTPATGEEKPNKWAVINTNKRFPTGPSKLPELCFADNYEIANDIEYYQITLNIERPVPAQYIAYANVSTLLRYKDTSENNAWDKQNNVLHLNFCDGNTWIFPTESSLECIECQPLSIKVSTNPNTHTISELRNFFRYSTDNGLSWKNGLDETAFPAESGLISIPIPAGYLLESLQPVQHIRAFFLPSSSDSETLREKNNGKYWQNKVSMTYNDGKGNDIPHSEFMCCCHYWRIRTLEKCYLGGISTMCDH